MSSMSLKSQWSRSIETAIWLHRRERSEALGELLNTQNQVTDFERARLIVYGDRGLSRILDHGYQWATERVEPIGY